MFDWDSNRTPGPEIGVFSAEQPPPIMLTVRAYPPGGRIEMAEGSAGQAEEIVGEVRNEERVDS